MAMVGMAHCGRPKNATIGSPSAFNATLTMPIFGSSSQSQMRPTTTGGISHGRMMSARMNMDLVRRDIITAMTMASTVCSGMFSST